jgi:DNA primase
MAAFDCSNVDVEEFLEALEIDNVSEATADEFRFSCPFPNHDNGDANASAYMNRETTMWFCHGCKERGDAKNFTAQVLGISPLEAIRLLREKYQPGYADPTAVKMVEEVRKALNPEKKKIDDQPLLPASALDRFNNIDWYAAHQAYEAGEGFDATDYMFERGFSPKALEEWEFGYMEYQHRITFAIRDAVGNLIGFKARSTQGQEPKYLVVGDKEGRNTSYGWPCYYPSRVVYGADRIKPDTSIIICEGELNVVSIWDKLRLPAVAINGSNFTGFHAKVIRSIAKDVTLFLDDDNAGNSAVWGWYDKDKRYHPGILDALMPFLPIRIVTSKKDAADLDAEDLGSVLDTAESATIARLNHKVLVRS